ncbi:hypothetical protein bthur0004_67550 [Bacillus thuringiensis serovar sotto str. T04001]|nr:hypothetical protein bthur0004_67550 [Bacillus thuringiensis serovar sotto str. T04001]
MKFHPFFLQNIHIKKSFTHMSKELLREKQTLIRKAKRVVLS